MPEAYCLCDRNVANKVLSELQYHPSTTRLKDKKKEFFSIGGGLGCRQPIV